MIFTTYGSLVRVADSQLLMAFGDSKGPNADIENSIPKVTMSNLLAIKYTPYS
ncbi:hypothetical protein [Alteromonas hispanica]|uniref:Uncharacterized protein n=1 Tax=Alteromonas hispanica TaxID=315421 RepID=A0A6L9MW08_9ALTE|nr:hypothetical protein [Alteromonas hispanica]NDW22412.1 hypothetical protein [Alteromonas hispanica]